MSWFGLVLSLSPSLFVGSSTRFRSLVPALQGVCDCQLDWDYIFRLVLDLGLSSSNEHVGCSATTDIWGNSFAWIFK